MAISNTFYIHYIFFFLSLSLSLSLSMGANCRTSALYFVVCLDTIRGFSEASYLELPLGTPRNGLSPEYDHPGVSPLVRCRGSTMVSLSRTPQRVPSRRTSSSTCFYRAPGSLPPYGQSRGSGSTDLSPSSCRPCKRPTRF